MKVSDVLLGVEVMFLAVLFLAPIVFGFNIYFLLGFIPIGLALAINLSERDVNEQEKEQ